MNTSKPSPHGTNRKTAIIVGVLYIIGTVAGILSVVLTQPILNTPDYLIQVSAGQNQIALEALFVLTMALALAMVPVMLYPILRKHNQVLALGYVVFRGALEPIPYILMAASRLLLIVVSQEYIAASAPSATYFQTLGAFVLKGHDAIDPILIIIFSLDALMLYYIFYQSELIPRWISVWGLVAILMHFSTAFLILFNIVKPDDMSTLMIINFPILIQEMIMAIWLIAKGFNPSVIAQADQA
jgi:hypothetical protein